MSIAISERNPREAKAETGELQAQADKDQGPPDAARSSEKRKDFSLESSEGTWSRRHLDFRLLTPRTKKESTSVVFNHLAGGHLSQQCRQTDTTANKSTRTVNSDQGTKTRGKSHARVVSVSRRHS